MFRLIGKGEVAGPLNMKEAGVSAHLQIYASTSMLECPGSHLHLYPSIEIHV